MGQPLKMQQRVKLVVDAPGHPRPLIRLLRNGVEVARKEGKHLEWTTAALGAYRAEVYARTKQGEALTLRRGLKARGVRDLLRARRHELRPWIFANPIYLRK